MFNDRHQDFIDEITTRISLSYISIGEQKIYISTDEYA